MAHVEESKEHGSNKFKQEGQDTVSNSSQEGDFTALSFHILILY